MIRGKHNGFRVFSSLLGTSLDPHWSPLSGAPENAKTRSQGPGSEFRLPLNGGSKKGWRRGWDSNPRWGCPHNGFRVSGRRPAVPAWCHFVVQERVRGCGPYQLVPGDLAMQCTRCAHIGRGEAPPARRQCGTHEGIGLTAQHPVILDSTYCAVESRPCIQFPGPASPSSAELLRRRLGIP